METMEKVQKEIEFATVGALCFQHLLDRDPDRIAERRRVIASLMNEDHGTPDPVGMLRMTSYTFFSINSG